MTDTATPEQLNRNNPGYLGFQRLSPRGVPLTRSLHDPEHSRLLQTPQPNTSFLNMSASPSFFFRERKGKINWRNIANLDIDKLIEEGDVNQLENYLSNITYAALDKEDFERMGDATLLKLFRLSQYGLEYLLNCQNYLAEQTQVLDISYRQTEDKLKPLEEQVKANQEEIMALKHELKYKKELLTAYQNALSAPIFKCHLCSKFFKSQEYLNSHIERKHTEAIKKIQQITNPPKKEAATSPLNRDNAESPKKTADRYTQNYKEENEERVDPKQSKGGVEGEGISTLNQEKLAAVGNTLLFEKMVQQLKQEEDVKLSKITLTIQEKLQDVIKTNKELNSKIAELEKKIDLGTPVKGGKRTLSEDAETKRESSQLVQEVLTHPSILKKEGKIQESNIVDEALKRATPDVIKKAILVNPSEESIKQETSAEVEKQENLVNEVNKRAGEYLLKSQQEKQILEQKDKTADINEEVYKKIPEVILRHKNDPNKKETIEEESEQEDTRREKNIKSELQTLEEEDHEGTKKLEESPMKKNNEKTIETEDNEIPEERTRSMESPDHKPMSLGDAIRESIPDETLLEKGKKEEDDIVRTSPLDDPFTQSIKGDEDRNLEKEAKRLKKVLEFEQLKENKYRYATPQQKDEAQKDMESAIQREFKRLFNLEYKELLNQETKKLEEILNELKQMNNDKRNKFNAILQKYDDVQKMKKISFANDPKKKEAWANVLVKQSITGDSDTTSNAASSFRRDTRNSQTLEQNLRSIDGTNKLSSLPQNLKQSSGNNLMFETKIQNPQTQNL